MQDPAPRYMQQAQVRLMFAHVRTGILINALASLILSTLVWSSVPGIVVISWEVLLLLVLGWRYRQFRRYKTLGKTTRNSKSKENAWRRRLIIGFFLTGLCWGVAGSIFQFYADSPQLTMLVILFMLGLTLLGMPFATHIKHAYLALLYAIIIPAGISFAWLHPNVFYEITAMVIIYLWGIHHASGLFRNFIENSFRLQWQAEKLDQDLFKSKQQLDEFFNNAPVEMYLKDREGKYLRINRQFEKLFGVHDQEVRGKLPTDIHYHELAESTRKHDLEVLKSAKIVRRQEMAFLTHDNKPHALMTVKFPLIDTQNEVYGLGAVVTDITQQLEDKNRIEHLANYDALTDLPNRRLLLDRLNRCLAYSRRYHHQGALLFLDLDNFKTINDSLGHSTGDLLLSNVARRLLKNLREEDTVARIGGDEFVILLPEIVEHAHLEHTYYTAEKLRTALEVPFHFPDQVLYITCSIGISLFDSNNKVTADDLLKQADSAMYSAKNASRNTCRFFSADMQREADARLKLHNDLRRSLAGDELCLHFQPQLDNHGRVVGAEALLRWDRPDFGNVPPAVFIPITEETGLILAIGEWIIGEACRHLQRWNENWSMSSLPYLAINISPKQFHHPNFVPQLKQIITETGIRPEQLALELTEGVEIENLEMNINKMHELKSFGVRLIIDDFGIGYSSLAYLKRLPLDAIKIDKAFINEIHTDSRDAAIVGTIINLTRKLGIKAIAEGVETEQQLAALEGMACSAFQGYHFSHPLPESAFAEYITQAQNQRESA